MGQDKALLKLNGRLLIEHARDVTKNLTEKVVFVGAVERYSLFGTTIPDTFPDCGPLGGIHAGLQFSDTDFNLFLSVDTPFIPLKFLRYLFAEAQRSQATVTYPVVNGHYQPLCAIYRQAFLLLAEAALQQRNYKIEPLFHKTSSRVIDEIELMKLGLSPSAFDNLNTTADWQQAQKRMKDQNV